MKSFTNSQFYHDTAMAKKVEIKFKPKSNETEIGYFENNKFESISTDMMYSNGMKLYVRVIMNVQLMNFSIIDTVADLIKNDVVKFTEELNKDGYEISENSDDFITFSGPSYEKWKGKQITSWINVDIPYIEKKLNSINILVNKIVGIYQTFCKQQEIFGNDVFYISKYVVKTKVYFCKDALSAVLYANYQKPNSYVKSIGCFINLPEFIHIDYRNMDKAIGCDLSVQHNGAANQVIESIFDDRFRITEINVQRFVQKDEKLIVSHFVSRSINIFKRDKNQALISRDAADGSIKINAINVNITEHPKLTTLLTEYIENFFKSNGKLHPKVAKTVSNFINKTTINKIMSVFAAAKSEEVVEEKEEVEEIVDTSTDNVEENVNEEVVVSE